MAFVRDRFTAMLKGVFAAGNIIELFTVMPEDDSGTDGTRLSGAEYTPYKITADDFKIDDAVLESDRNIMLYLCDTENKNYEVTAVGFGVYTSDGTGRGKDLLYYGRFENPMKIGYNTVPTIKKYSATKREGIKITVTNNEEPLEEVNASAE